MLRSHAHRPVRAIQENCLETHARALATLDRPSAPGTRTGPGAGRCHRGRPEQQASRCGRVEDLRRRSRQHALRAARSDQQGQLLEAADRLAPQHRPSSAPVPTSSIRPRRWWWGTCSTRPPARGAPCWRSTPRTGEVLWVHTEDEGPRGQNAARSGAGRGVSYWSSADGSDQRIIYVTPGYRMIALNAKTGIPIPTFGKDGVVDLKLDNDQDLDLVTADLGLNATPLVAGDVVVVGSAQRFSGSPRIMNNARGIRPRVRRQVRQAAVDLPHRSPAGGVRVRHVGRQFGAAQRQHRGVGAVQRRSRARPRLRAGRDADRRFLRRKPSRQHAVRREPGRARHQDRHAQVALPDHPSRCLGLRPAVRADPVRHDARRPAHQGAGAAHQAVLPLRPQS